MLMNKRISATVGALLAVAAASAGAALASDGGIPSPKRTQIPAARVQPVDKVPSTLSSAFKLFRTEGPTVVPPAVAEGGTGPNAFGRNAALARAIPTQTGTGYVIPGDGFVCIIVPDPVDGWAEGCLPTAAAIEQGVDVGLTARDGRTIETSLVPDGARAVQLVGPLSTRAPVASASSVRHRVPITTAGVVSVRTNAPGSIRVVR